MEKKTHYVSELLHDLDFWHLESSPAASQTHPVTMIYDDELDDFSRVLEPQTWVTADRLHYLPQNQHKNYEDFSFLGLEILLTVKSQFNSLKKQTNIKGVVQHFG